MHSFAVAVGTHPLPLHSFFPAHAFPAVAHPAGPLQELFAAAHAPCPLQELRPPQCTLPAEAVADLPSEASAPCARSVQKAETMSALRVGVFMEWGTHGRRGRFQLIDWQIARQTEAKGGRRKREPLWLLRWWAPI